MFNKKFDPPKVDVEPFDAAATSDVEAHEAVALFIDVAGAAGFVYPEPPIKERAGGPRLVEADATWNRRCVLALAGQDAHWNEQMNRIRVAAPDECGDPMRQAVRGHPEWDAMNYRRVAVSRASTELLSRKLPLAADDVAVLAEVCVAHAGTDRHGVPPLGVVKQAVQCSKRGGEVTPRLVKALSALAAALRTDARKPLPKQALTLESLLADVPRDIPKVAGEPPPPAPVGPAGVLVALQQRMGMMPADDAAAATSQTVSPEAFALRADSSLAAEHAAVGVAIEGFLAAFRWMDATHDAAFAAGRYENQKEMDEFAAMKERALRPLASLPPRERARHFLAACERELAARTSPQRTDGGDAGDLCRGTTDIRKGLTVHEATGDRAADFARMFFASCVVGYGGPAQGWMLTAAESYAAGGGLSDGERHVLHRLRCASVERPPFGTLDAAAARLTRLIDGDATLLLVPGEHWADRAHAEVSFMSESERGGWIDVLKHALTATAAKPSAAWRKQMKALAAASAPTTFHQQIGVWLDDVGRGRSVVTLGSYIGEARGAGDGTNDGNADVLKGLAWALADAANGDAPRALGRLVLACVKKVPGVGPRSPKVAGAGVWALGEMAAGKDAATRDAALGQLARLKARVTFRTTLKAIETALDKAAAKAGVAKEDLEELGVPGFGFENGVRVEELGGATATLRLDGNKVTTIWTNDKAKVVKAPPAAVKKEFKDDLKEIKQAADDAAGVLLAGRDRLDNLYLADKSWRLSDFRERYLNHGLLGPLVRRLIWTVDETPVLFNQDAATEVAGHPVELGETAEVRLWHPIHADTDTVIAWRDRLASLQITQPFKQAHREVYLLTDAERRTNTYSNRFAAHVVRQHQFNALCAARGWRNQLRLMVDDSYEPPRRELPAHGLRAEFWVEGIGDDFGTDTTDSGSYLRLATDQVRFYRTGAAKNYQHAGGGRYDTYGPDEADNHPLPLDQIPPIVLSEVLRDCDLFVGVSSVGNDPTWQDGGPEGRFRDYWHSYSFGDLNQTAQTRKTVLEKLVPRLKITDRCSFSDKFLVVRGERRTYKIHLGSGNILMEPNDQYLCIVPGRQADASPDSQFLPFEGDRTMSVIVSKALMLADDAKIKDPTINSQIGRAK